MSTEPHRPPIDPDAQLGHDVAKAGALGCLAGMGAFGVFLIASLLGLVLLVLVGSMLLFRDSPADAQAPTSHGGC